MKLKDNFIIAQKTDHTLLTSLDENSALWRFEGLFAKAMNLLRSEISWNELTSKLSDEDQEASQKLQDELLPWLVSIHCLALKDNESFPERTSMPSGVSEVVVPNSFNPYLMQSSLYDLPVSPIPVFLT